MGSNGTRRSVVRFAPLRMVDDLFLVFLTVSVKLLEQKRTVSLTSEWK